jgi:hypothetical protein
MRSQRSGARTAVLVLLVLVVGALTASATQAASPPIATVMAATPLSGGGGWLVWSQPVPGGWALMGDHDGTVARLPTAVRPQPFDASVGTDVAGLPVVTFSRCARTPPMRTVGEQGGGGGALLEPASGAGCRIRVLELTDGAEIKPLIPAPQGVSDTTPSIWHGQIAFARYSPSHGDVWQIESWSPSARNRLKTLPHGRIPSCPEEPHGCTQKAHGMVEALQRDGAIVTFLWVLPWPQQGLVGEGAWEVRVDRADGSRAALAAGDFGHEACTAPVLGPHELEYVWPLPPIAAGNDALFGELLGFSCFHGFASLLVSHSAESGFAIEGKLQATALALADDRGQLYGLIPARNAATGGDSPGCSAAEPCAIETLATPALRRAPRLPFVPFQ